MANHVTSRVEIQCNEAAQVLVEKWVTIVDAMDNSDHKMVWNLMENVPDEVTYEWTTVNIGTKWCYVEEIYDNTLVLESAWDFPIKFTDWVSEQILAIDEDATITVTYEDEGANFAGYHIYTSLGERSDCIDYDELVALTEQKITELADLDPDGDEYFDMMQENIFDTIYTWQDEQVAKTEGN
jgi:hypothetical protein